MSQLLTDERAFKHTGMGVHMCVCQGENEGEKD